MIALKKCTVKEMQFLCKNKELYCFGSGNQANWLRKENFGFNIAKYIIAFIDNNTQKSGEVKIIDDIKVPIISYEEFVAHRNERTIVITTSMYYVDMITQMDEEPRLEQMPCYIDVFMDTYEMNQNIVFTKRDEIKIPRTIHYCWFGNDVIPEELQSCIASWKKYCPNYEIVCWNEKNYDVTKNRYMKEAYENQKWAFVSDYARVDIINQYGGIYLDTDVEVIKPLDDLLYDEFYCGFELGGQVAFGLGFGARKNHYLLEALLDKYETIDFIRPDGTFNLTPCPQYQTECLKAYGLITDGKYQRIKDMVIYPMEVFAPKSFYDVYSYFSEYTYTIHHYNASWFKSGCKESVLEANVRLKKRMEV